MLIKLQILARKDNGEDDETTDYVLKRLQGKTEPETKYLNAMIKCNSINDIDSILDALDEDGNYEGYSTISFIDTYTPFTTSTYTVNMPMDKLYEYVKEQLENNFDDKIVRLKEVIKDYQGSFMLTKKDTEEEVDAHNDRQD